MEGYVAKTLEELEHIFPNTHIYGSSNTMPNIWYKSTIYARGPDKTTHTGTI